MRRCSPGNKATQTVESRENLHSYVRLLCVTLVHAEAVNPPPDMEKQVPVLGFYGLSLSMAKKP